MGHYMTDKEYQSAMKKAKLNNLSKARKLAIKEEKARYSQKPWWKRFETSKALAIYLLVLMNLIIIYALVAMWHFGDLSYLGVLITDVVAQIVTYAIYCVKAFKGKQAEEEMNFKREQLEQSVEEEIFEDASEV